jgi:hypothetical protein
MIPKQLSMILVSKDISLAERFHHQCLPEKISLSNWFSIP